MFLYVLSQKLNIPATIKTVIHVVVGDGFNLMVALMIIKNKSNFILLFQITADSVSPSGLFNTEHI